MKLFIDGENFRHQIAHILASNGKIADAHQYFRFNWAGFLAEVSGSSANDSTYYTTRIKQPSGPIPVKLQRRIAAISAANRSHVADLTNQGVRVVKAGFLKVRESSLCVHCGKKTLVLQEKGVDVRVATDLLLAGMNGARDLLLVSSDSDLVPALNAVGQKGAQVTYLCYAGWLNRAVTASVHKTLTFDDNLVLKHYMGMQHGK